MFDDPVKKCHTAYGTVQFRFALQHISLCKVSCRRLSKTSEGDVRYQVTAILSTSRQEIGDRLLNIWLEPWGITVHGKSCIILYIKQSSHLGQVTLSTVLQQV